ncbi:MAG: hypothetical protein WD738_00270 [Pirellulales bacterium]
MTIDIDATYRDGALHPETPLNLPEEKRGRSSFFGCQLRPKRARIVMAFVGGRDVNAEGVPHQSPGSS